MKKYVLTTGLIIISAFCATGQNNTTSGYIIVNNDTLSGSVVYDKAQYTPSYINFNDRDYSPADIKGYGYDFYHYISQKINGNDIFLKTIVNGNTGLYSYYSSTEGLMYVLKVNGEYHPLDNQTSTYTSEGKTYEKKSIRYKGQLNYHLNDCPEIADKISRVGYNKNDLKNVIISYAKCRNEDFKYYNPKVDLLSLSFGIYAGYGISQFDFTELTIFYEFISQAEFESINKPFFGVSLDVTFNSLIFTNEFAYHKYVFSGNYLQKFNNSTVNDVFVFNHEYARINSMIGYRIFSNLHIQTGISQNIMTREIENSRTRIQETSFGITEYSTHGFEDMNHYEFGYIINLGFSHKNYLMELRYEIGKNMISGDFIPSRRNSANLLLSYRF